LLDLDHGSVERINDCDAIRGIGRIAVEREISKGSQVRRATDCLGAVAVDAVQAERVDESNLCVAAVRVGGREVVAKSC
jgi:hypothetical protein